MEFLEEPFFIPMNLLADPSAHPVIGHRGMASAAPENTIEAMEMAFSYGADAVEFDLRLSADGEVVVMHDPRVDRTTNGTGEVAALEYAQLRELDAGARFVPQAVDNRPPPPSRKQDGSLYPEYLPGYARPKSPYAVPRFKDVLERFNDRHLLIEIKAPEAAESALALIQKFGAQSRCMIDSYSDTALGVFRGTGIPVGAGKEGVTDLLKSFFLLRKSAVVYDGMCVPERFRNLPLPIRLLSRIAHDSRKTIHVWTVNIPADAQRLWRVGVNGIITDDVRPILEARQAMAT